MISYEGLASPRFVSTNGCAAGAHSLIPDLIEGVVVPGGHPCFHTAAGDWPKWRLWLAIGATLAGCFLAPAWLEAKEITFYVARDGNDAWSGKLKSPAADNSDGPLATIPAAMAVARKARLSSRPADDLTIRVRRGTYELAEPLAFDGRDSGAAPDHPFVVQAFQGEHPVISGGRHIADWKRVPGVPDRWQAEVPGVAAGRWYFRQLFLNGRRARRARFPREGFFRVDGASPAGHPVALHFRGADIKPEWAARGDVELVALLSWSDFRLQIRSVDASNRIATLSGDAAESNRETDARYYVENAPLTEYEPGEWFLDRQTGLLTYQAEAGQNPNAMEVVAPCLHELVLISGDPAGGKPVRNLVFRGLSFAHTDWSLGDHGYTDTQAAVSIRGDFRAEGAVDCAVERCRFEHLAGYAMEFGRGCQGIHLLHNEISDIGAGGLRLGDPSGPAGGVGANYGNVVTDNHLHDLGQVYAPGIGVLVFQSHGNLIAHNHIHDLYYTAISVGWNWGYQFTACHDNIIEFNHLHAIGRNMLSDMGAIYTLGPQPGTVIRNNLIHDVESFTYGGWGIYPDEGSSFMRIENNIVYRTKSAGFHQHYGSANLVRNNIFAFGREYQLMRSRAETHLSFTFEKNIVYFDIGGLLGGRWTGDEASFRMADNLYFDARPGGGGEKLKFGDLSLEEWRKLGHDRGSIVADPLFVDPARYDFRLRAESPALHLGFKPIDIRGVGVRP